MLITSKHTADPAYVTALLAQEDIVNHLAGIRGHNHPVTGDDSNLYLPVFDSDEELNDIHSFEDIMNGLSGELLSIDSVLLEQIRAENARIISLAAESGFTCSLHESVLPQTSSSSNTSTETFSITQVGKKVYPLTTTVEIVQFGSSSNIETTQVVESVEVIDLDTADTIDVVFDELDEEASNAIEIPFAYEQNETIPILSEGMKTLSKECAANSAGLQAGLKTLSKNPLEMIIADARDLVIYHTANNYASLNVALAGVYSDPALSVQYKTLREAIGGSDGLSSCVAQLDIFKDHTDRLSGLVLAVNSPNAEPTGNSLTEYIHVNSVPEGNLIPIFSFNAKKFRSAKYMIQASAANTDRGHQATELYILHDNELAYTREVVSIYTQDPFVSFTTQFLNSNVRVLANVSADNTDFVIHGTKLRIARTAENYEEMSQQAIIVSHETLQAYLDDGVDYILLQSGSLLRSDVIAKLAREFNDMLAILSSPAFLAQSTGAKQAEILSWADDIIFCRNEIQSSIDTDYDNFVRVRKLVEALNISQNLTIAYTSETSNTILKTSLNTETVSAIETV